MTPILPNRKGSKVSIVLLTSVSGRPSTGAGDAGLANGGMEPDSVDEVRDRHRRKRNFMPGFERLVAGGIAREEQLTFLDRAKKRWKR